jgi:hypothetical protein
MSEALPVVCLVRHDLPLNADGEVEWNYVRYEDLRTARILAERPDWQLAGKYLLNTASLSALGYEHNLSQPVIRLWNDDPHLAA